MAVRSSATLFMMAVALLANNLLFAAPNINNNAGTWTDLYNDNLGVSSVQQTVVDGASGVVKLVSGQTAGDFTTVRVKPTSFDAWGSLTLDGTWAAASDVTVTLLDTTDTVITGFNALPYTGPISLAGLSATTYPEVKVKVGLTKSTLAPVVTSVQVTWNPISLLLLDKKAPATVQAGQVVSYRIRYSTSFVEARDLVVWDTLPNTATNTITYPASYGQNDNVTFVSATGGGVYTATALTVKGVSIPANSVYWDLGTKKEGTTDTLTFSVKTRNGTLNGTTVSNQALADAANAAAVTSQVAVTTVTALPAPLLEKRAGAGIYTVRGETLTRVNSENYFSIRAENSYTGEGRETMYDTVIYDKLTDLVGKIDPDLGGAGVPVKNISNGGTYVASYTPPAGGAAFPAVVWNVGTMEPGTVFTASFGVRLLDSPPLASTGQYINSAYIDSVRTRSPVRTLTPLQKDLLVKWPLDETPTGSFAKGDNLRGVFQINATRDDDQLLNDLAPWSPTNPYLYVKPGGVLPFGLLVSNNGLSAMNDLVFLDKIPAGTTFKSAWFTDPWFQANAKVFYSTTDTANANTPPAYDYTAAPADLDASGNTFWENYATNPPSNVADVRWVAFYIPAVNSVFFDSSSPGWVSGAPQGGVAYYDVTVSPSFLDPDPCTDGFISNRALFRAHRYTPLNGGAPLTTTLSAQDDETTRVSIDKAILAVDGRGTVSTPIMTDPGNLTYTVKVKNTGEAIAGGVQVELRWPQTDVNGVLQYLPFVSVTPSAVTTFDPANGRVVVNMGNLAPGAISTAAITVLVPEGVSYGEQLTFNSTISAAPAACPIAPVIDQASAVAEMLPLLRVVKDDVLDLIPGASELDYTLTVYNEGDSPSHGTYVVDRVPAEMVFVRAYGPQGEQLLFSADDNLPPGYLTPSAPVSAATIATKFTPGILNNNGTPSDPSDDVWTSPFGEQTRWVAWQMDDASLTPPAFITGTARSVSFRVRNDLDGPGSGTAGSAVGTVIFNSGAVFSEELLQAIGNEVVTTINDSPAILVQKTGPSAVNTGVSFAWTIQYYNNSGTTDDVVSIVDTLPAGVTFQSATHTWNAAALANGAPPANNGLAVPSSVVSNPDGTTTVTFDIAGTTGYRGNGDDLAPSEGGTLVIQAQVNAGITSGANLLNHVSATATTGTDTSTSSDDHLVIVRNAELRMVKTSSQPNPIAGDEVTYNLVISNVSAIPAEGVVLTDVLSPDMTYVTGSFLVLTPGYTAGAPVISSGTLSWSIANGNAITKSPLAAGTLPANSGNIVLQYRATVNAGVPAGTALPNTATVTTTTPEDGTYPNTDTETITTPHPDPAILKSGVAFTSPGDRFNWEIRYWNNLRQSANNVYVIDTLPDYNANGEADLTYVTSNAPAGVTAYFHAAASGSVPAFNPLSPTTGGWSAAPTTPVNHIAWLVGTLAGEAGPFTITVTTDAIAPNGGAPALLPAGVNLQNLASIHTTDTDQVPENSSDDHVTRTPGNDVSLTKTASAEGSTPGIAPGKPLTYTLRVENSGTQTAYGIEILDTLPTGVTLGSPEDNFLELALDENGTSTAPLDALGNPITGSVPVTRVVSGNTVRWYLGTNNASDTLYFRKVGLPSGAGQTFEVYVTINANVADSTTLVNSATVTLRNQSDTDPAEAVTTNNTDDSRVTVFLPDLTVSKSVKNVSDASEQWTEAGRVLEYTLEYDNAGNMTAQDVTLSEIIPAGTTFVPGSIVGAEDASNVVLQDYDQDGRIDAFDIQWASLPAPAFFAGEDLKCYGLSAASAVKISSTVGGFGGTVPNLGRFGNDVAVIGDVDADGVTDLAVGNYLYDGGAVDIGAVWIVFRNADGTVKGQSLISDNVGGMPAGEINSGDNFGSSVTALGDFNGDGTPDIAVGSSGYKTEGALYVLFLKPDGTVDSYERISNNSGGINATWISTNDGLGTSLELVGDVNNDGAPDLIVGSPGYDGALVDEGNAFLLFMNPDRSGKAFNYAKINGDTMGVPILKGDALSTSVTGIGDINADGVPDVAIGAVRDTTLGSAVYIVTLKNTGEPLATTVIDGTASVFEGKVARTSRFGIGLSGGVDFNTDGIADLVVGAYGDDGAPTGTRPFAGAAYILFMNRDSSVAGMNKFSAATQTALSGLDSSDNFGFGLAAAQDLSGDGVPDIIGGAPQDDDGGSNRGAIWQLNLQTGSLPCTLNGTYVQAGQLYSPPANAEALDTPVKLAASHAAFAGLLEDNEEFGSSVSGIGDINNDGFQDIAIGSWKRAVAGVQVGAVYIVRMGAGRSVIGVNRITTGESGFTPTLLLNDRFGSAVAGLGDISGDGTHAIAVGSYNDDDGGANSNRGAVWIVYLNANGTVNRTQKISSTAGGFSGPLVNTDNFGWALAAVPDMDGDSVPELLSTAYGDDTGGSDRGAVYLLRLNSNGTVKSHQKIAHGVGGFPIGQIDNGDRLGSGVAVVGDLDGDDVNDFVLGAEQDDDGASNRGAVYVCFMNSDGTVRAIQKISSTVGGFTGVLDASDFFGTAVTAAGDVNGDGVPDLVVGAKNDDDVPEGGSGSNRGAVWLLTLNANGTTQAWRKTSAATSSMSAELALNDQYGQAVGSLGDLDGDGFIDIGAAASLDDTGGANRGAVWIASLTPVGHYLTGTYEKLVNVDCLVGWRDLIVDQTVPDGTAIEWSILTADGSHVLFGPNNMSSGLISVGSIDPKNTEVLVRAVLTSESRLLSPQIHGWKLTYYACEKKQIKFRVTVDDPAPAGQTAVDNTVSISTSTPESSYTNNVADDSILLRLTDVEVTKTASRVSARPGDTVFFTLQWTVNGPQEALGVTVKDTLPAGFTFINSTPAQTSSDGQVFTWELGNQGASQTGTIIVETTVDSGTLPDTYTNVVRVTNDRQETDTTNNEDSVPVVVVALTDPLFANVWTSKSGPATAPLGGLLNYTITYGSNGGGDADNVVITDLLPAGLTFASAVPAPTSVSGQTVTWNMGTLVDGATGSITLTAQVGTNYLTLHNQSVINYAAISTTSTEVSLADNADDHPVTLLGAPAAIGGRVWFDADADQTLDGTESGLANVLLTLTGTDVFGNPVTATQYTGSDGTYSFTGLTPGTYQIVETQPAGHKSTVDLLGTVSSVARGTNSDPLDDQFTSITLNSGDRGENYNFGEVTPASVGDKVWIDHNGDGVQDVTEPGIGGVLVFIDSDNDGVYDVGEPSATTTADGLYHIENLLPSTYTVMVDASTLPAGVTQTGDPDTTVDHKTSVTLTHGQDLLTADFGYQGNASLGDYVWNDLDADGVQDATELPISGVVVFLDLDNDGIKDANEPADTTDSAGLYGFTGLIPGTYTVMVDSSTLPAGVTQTGDPDATVDHKTSITLAAGDNTLTADFGYKGDASLGDYVWNDADGDGVQDATELPISGVVVFLDLDNDGIKDANEPTDTTDSAGLYGFTNLIPGTYTVMVDASTLPAGVTQTGDPDASVDHKTSITLAAGDNALTADFGYQGNASLGDYVWNDFDADGVQDATELPISGVVVFLDLDNDGIKDANEPADTTDSAGLYGFTGLIPGAYTVMVDASTLPAGVTQTGDPDATVDHKTSITLAAGDNTLTADFGYQGNASLGDYVWSDADADGVQDAAELPITGVVVFLDLDNDGIKDANEPTDTTDGAGLYGFTGLIPGAYTVMVDSSTLPAGVTQTGDPDATVDHKTSITLAAGDNTLTADFGYQGNASLGDYVWNDLDADGVQDATELPISGVVVFLDLDNDGIKDANEPTDTTDSAGLYGFTNLIPGTYTVMVDASTLPAGVSQTGDPDATVDHKTSITLAAGENTLTADFGYQGNANLGDYVWSDADADGVQDATELPISGVVVFLDLDNDGIKDANEPADTTDSAGLYGFTGLIPGTYTVMVDANTLPAGITQTGDPDATVDHKTSITLAAGDNTLTADFGYKGDASLGDYVWNDADADGVQDANELPISGVVVFLDLDNDGIKDANEPTDTTDSAGLYGFTNLIPGTYTVMVDSSTLPAGVTQTGDPDASVDHKTSITLAAGDNTLTADFGYQGNASLGDYVWNDFDADGVQDATELPISGVVVFLDLDNDGIKDANEPADTTDSAGLYGFTGLIPGTYTVMVDSSTLPAGVAQTGDPDATVDHKTSITLAAGDNTLTADFGYQGNASLGDYVWSDADADGVQDATELPISGVVVFLDLDNDGIKDANEPTDTTDSSGLYGFTNLIPGTYTVMVDASTLPAGVTQTGDPDATADHKTSITLAAGDNTLTADFGYQGNASLGDYVWNDLDADGVQDATELPISGVVVFLDLDNDGIKDANEPTDTTDSAGLYGFTNLIPGTYTVMVDASTLPAGVTQTGDPDATVDHKTSITLAAGDNTITADFGYQGNASLGDYVWNDADADGVQDAAELALPNVRLFLDLDGDGSLDSNEPTQVTDSMGHYSFTGLIPGSYTVKVDASTLPLGAAQSADPDATLDNMTTLALAAGDDVLTADFGYQSPPYRLSGQVRLDSDGDGDLGDSDGGIAGVVIRLYNDPNGDGDPADGTLLAIAVTDASGHYDFSGLPAGSYVVTESNPATAVSSADVTGANDDRVSATITNADITGRDFLDKSIVLHAIRGTVLDDGTPDDGAFGAGDTPIAGAVIQLFKDLNTDGIAQSGELIATTATLLDGSYAFINLPDASDYLIIETNPAGFISENDVAGSATDDLITTSIAGADSTGNDFLDDTGVVHSISGTVRDDYDVDGSFSDNDQPVSGVTVTLYADINGNGVYDPQTDTRLGSTVTNSLGQYLFTGLGDGSYLVVETDPVASTSTADVQSANDNLIPVTLAGVDSSQNDFLDAVDPAGYIYSSVTGQIIGGGTITVTGPGVVTITQDGSSGQYSWITDGTPGTYTMTYAPPLGYIIDPTRPVTGASLDPTGQPDPYALGSSENALNPGYLTTSTAVGNPYYFTFDLASGDPFVINNNIPLVEVKPSSFAAWQYANPLGGQNGPNDDPDGDGVPNLAEFAFCYNPSSGIHRGCPFELEVQSGGSVNALLRRLQTSSGLTYTLQSLTDLSLSPAGWTDVTTLVPTLVSNGDGTQTATYTAVDALPALSSGQGFLRVKITDTASGASVVTDVSGFTKQLLGLGCVSSSMPYLPCPRATGSIDSVVGSTLVCSTSAGTGSYITALAAGKQHYIEITSGENEGHRYEIDEAATTATALAIDLASALNTQATLPATLATDTWELRTHHTINELYPPAAFTSTNNPNTADRILIPNGAAFTTYWLYTNSGSPKWVVTSDATRVDQGGVILPPCAGYFVHPKTVQVSRTYAGRVRANDFICPLPIGSSMIAGGWPLDQSPNSRAMTTIANAFVSSSSPTNADKILTWQGDSVSDATAYDTYAYLTTSSGGRWVKTQNAGLTDQGNTPFLKSLRAVFVKVTTAHPTWIMPLPWTP